MHGKTARMLILLCLCLLALAALSRGMDAVAGQADERPMDGGAGPAIASSTSSGCLPRYGEPQFIIRLDDQDWHEPALQAGDINGDGLDDIVVWRMLFGTTKTFSIDILLNDGKGNFVLGTSSVFSGSIRQVQSPASEILIADFNGDGRNDIFVPDFGKDADPFPGYQNTLLLSTPDGRLVDATANLPQQVDNTHDATYGDIDKDGDLDLYLDNNWGQNLIHQQILLNDGTGRFTVAANSLPPSVNLYQNGFTGSEFVDVNNDGYPDLVLSDAGDDLSNEHSTRNSVVSLNDGTGNFTTTIALPPKPFSEFAVGQDIEHADLNRDGYQDLIIAYTKQNYTGGRYFQVLINQGDGTFRDETATRLPQAADNSDPYAGVAELMDIDRDGDMDYLPRPWDDTAPNPLLFVNDGNGYFTQEALDFHLRTPFFTFLDIDGDGGHDLAFATFSPPEDIYIIRELGCPVFLPLVSRSWSAGD